MNGNLPPMLPPHPDFHNLPLPQRVVNTPPVVYAISPYSNGTCIAALVLGLCTLISFGMTAIPAVICGHLGLTQCKRGQANQKGMAITGVVFGYLTIAGWVIWFLFWGLMIIVGSASSGSSS